MSSLPENAVPAADPAFALPQQPLSVGGILDAGIRMFRNGFKELFPVAAIMAIPYALLSAQMNSHMIGIDAEANPDVALAASMQTLAYVPVIYLLLVFIASCVIHRQIALTRSEPTSLAADLGVGLKLLIPLTLVMFLYIILAALGFLLLLVPGIIIIVSMSLFIYVPQVEEHSAWSSLWRSHKLVWGGNWWRTAIVLSVVSIIGMVLSIVAYFGLGALAVADATGDVAAAPSTSRMLIEAALSWMTMALILPLSTAVMHVHYNDLLLRKEGGDLESKLDDLSPTTAA